MRRKILIALLALAGIAVVALLAGAGWLLGTGAGARWAIGLAGRAVPGGRLEVREIRGVLASPLELSGVRLATPSLDLTVGRIQARWSLGAILLGRLDVRSLAIDSVRVVTLAARDTASAKPGPPPRMPSLRAPLDVRVRRLVLRGLDVRAAGDSAGLTLTEGRLTGRWHDDRLRLDTLALRSPLLDADLRGEIGTAGPWRFDLSSEWALRPPDLPELRGRGRTEGTLAAWHIAQRLDAPFGARLDARGALDPADLSRPPRKLSARLEFERLEPRAFAPRTPPMTLDGRIVARGEIDRFDATLTARMRSDSLPDLDLEAALAREGRRVNIGRLVATRPGGAGRVEAHGWISGLFPVQPKTPLATDVTVDWRSLAWPLDGEALVRSEAGRLRLRGTPRQYTLGGSARLATRGFDALRMTLDSRGDSTSLDVSRLAIEAPRESLIVSGSLGWKPGFRWSADLRAGGLDPSVLWPAWPGQIALVARARGAAAESILVARVVELGGTLRGHPLAGGGAVAGRGSLVMFDDLRVAWGNATFELRGERGNQWDVRGALVAPSLAVLDTLAGGRLSAEFRIDGPVGAPAIHLEARGDSLVLGGASVGALDLSGTAGLRPEDPTRLGVKARSAVLAGVPLDRLELSASGTTARHVLGASAFTPRESLFVEIGGGLDRSRWTGSLDRLDLHSFHAGSWALEHPVPIAASAESVAIRPLNLRSGGSSLGGEGAWTAHQGWSVFASLVHTPLALLDPFLPGGARIEGQLDGRLEGRSAGPRGPVRGDVDLTESPTLLLVPASRGKVDTLALAGGKLGARLDPGGLKAEMELATTGKSRLTAHVELPGFDPLAAERASQPLSGRISASGTLDGLDAFVTGIRDPRGSFTADLDLKGTLGRPELAGEAHVKDGAVTLASLGVTFSEIQVDATPLEGGKLAIAGGARSTRGRLTLGGSFDPRAAGGAAAKLELKGEGVTVADTRDLQVRVSPDLALEWAAGKAALSGRVNLPFARIQLAGMAPTAQAPSPDIVFVGANAESSKAGLRVSSRVRLGIKDDVEVRGVGYRVKPEGSLLLIDEPDEVTRATGELKINEGTYKAYGQDLVIERGRLVFGGGPVSNPGVDVRASRTADDGTIAGILITGTAQLPVLQLFSVPSMSDANVLSYIMSGKPLDESSGLAKGASSALGVQGGDALARSLAGQMGLPEASVESSGGMQEASLFLGTYLSPRLYMAYGIGLFEDTRTLRLRYSVASRWSLQAESGKAQSGIIQYRGER